MRNANGRTAIALAFGEHPGQCCGVRYGADKEFFSGAVLPFIEDQAARKGKQVIIIHEFNVGYHLAGVDRNDPVQADSVRRLVQETEMRANAELAETLDAGRMPTTFRDWLDWGYLEGIVEINTRSPGRIRNIIEPLRDSTVWRMWDQTLTSRKFRSSMDMEARVKFEIEIIRQSIGICLERSRRVVALVKEMRLENPGAAFVIPRGYAHKGMAEDFDFVDFEKIVSSGLRGAPHFSSEAIAESFARELSEPELRRYAILTMRYDEYMGKNGCRVHGGRDDPENMPVENIWEASANARGYALGLNGKR